MPSPAMGAFEHIPLSDSSSTFRLLQLTGAHSELETPEEDDDGQVHSIAFTIKEYDLHSPPQYSALSYCWGNPEKTRTIVLNRKTFPLHENLWHFLQQVESENDQCLYWTDAICIDQGNVAERDAQVGRMAEIYAQAVDVVAWLGPDVDVREALESLEKMSALPAEAKWPEDSAEEPAFRACSQVLSAEYWERAWIVQELALAKRVWLKCDRSRIPLEVLNDICSRTNYYRYKELAESMMSTVSLHDRWTLLGKFIHGFRKVAQQSVGSSWWGLGVDSFSLLDWVMRLDNMKCSNRHDRIYSLLGMHRKLCPESPRLTVDYARDLRFVSWDCIFMLASNLRRKRGNPLGFNGGSDAMRRMRNWITSQKDMFATYPSGYGPLGSLVEYVADPGTASNFAWLGKLFLSVIVTVGITANLLSTTSIPPLDSATSKEDKISLKHQELAMALLEFEGGVFDSVSTVDPETTVSTLALFLMATRPYECSSLSILLLRAVGECKVCAQNADNVSKVLLPESSLCRQHSSEQSTTLRCGAEEAGSSILRLDRFMADPTIFFTDFRTDGGADYDVIASFGRCDDGVRGILRLWVRVHTNAAWYEAITIAYEDSDMSSSISRDMGPQARPRYPEEASLLSSEERLSKEQEYLLQNLPYTWRYHWRPSAFSALRSTVETWQHRSLQISEPSPAHPSLMLLEQPDEIARASLTATKNPSLAKRNVTFSLR